MSAASTAGPSKALCFNSTQPLVYFSSYSKLKQVVPLSRAISEAIAAVLLVVLIVGALGVYYVVNESPKTDQNASPMQTPSPTLTSTSSPTPTLNPTTTPTTTGANGTLQLNLTMEKTAFSLGEPVNLTVTITNISNQTINYTHTGLDFDFQVYNDTNNIVYQWSNFMGIAQFVTIEPLPAGENRSQNFTWQQTCNFNASVQGTQVSAGTYYIVGLTGPTYGLQTAPIQITIANP
jgi:hypothetical protein